MALSDSQSFPNVLCFEPKPHWTAFPYAEVDSADAENVDQFLLKISTLSKEGKRASLEAFRGIRPRFPAIKRQNIRFVRGM